MKKQSNKPKTDYATLGKMLVNIYETGYIDQNKSYKQSFIKGMLGGVGGVIGATIVIALLVWVLNLLGNIDLLKPFVQKTTETIQQQ